eukprot:Partr_v1_DN27973_c1_g1_i4_m11662 putative DSPc
MKADDLQLRKLNLSQVDQIKVTSISGAVTLHCRNGEVVNASSTNGFVVDTKPDIEATEIIPNSLYLGSQDSALDSRERERIGFTHILNLAYPLDYGDRSICTAYIPLLDLPDQQSQVSHVCSKATKFIHDTITDERNRCLVHCNAGISRAPFIVIAYLIKYRDMPLSEAYDLVKQKRPAIRPNEGFMRYLQQLKPSSSYVYYMLIPPLF